ncbi:MAG: hypothetical protein LBQ76_07910 [Candidatus Fibromonas sp.]|jgi:hypothetical protein|nr:hypothetical protein [Candidatus Fibromonas sp.]
MKKVLTAALLCAVSAFATWDYFPVKPAGKGEVKAGVEYMMQDKLSALGINAGARFSVIEGLEIAAMFNFPMTLSNDGDSCEGDACPPSFSQPVIGVRYWLPMGLGIALDVALPFQGEDYLGGGDAANLTFTPAVQYSTKFTEELELGSEVSFSIPLENGNKLTPSMELGIGLELDYSLGLVTPYVGVDVALQLTKPQFDGNDAGETATGIAPKVGAIFAFNEMFGADVGVAFGIGEDYYGEKMPITIGANFSFFF